MKCVAGIESSTCSYLHKYVDSPCIEVTQVSRSDERILGFLLGKIESLIDRHSANELVQERKRSQFIHSSTQRIQARLSISTACQPSWTVFWLNKIPKELDDIMRPVVDGVKERPVSAEPNHG